MNIFGEGFPEEIIKQIDYRQKVYGSGYTDNVSSELRNEDQILYLNANSAWCKLSSGVDISSSADINNPTIKSLKLNGDELAKKFVLFNGTFDTINGEQKSGISPVDSILGDNYAYGIGGTDFGLRPMMGIQSANIKHENRGSLRRAQVKIKAFNRAQFEIIDSLYLRLGFTVFLEWGHSIIINNSGVIDTKPTNLGLTNDFLEGKYKYDEFLLKLYNQRLKNGGNYDGMLAKVVNFSWTLNTDNSYDITVHLSSIGDIIESLKINILLDSPGTNNSNDSGDKPGTDSNSEDIIDYYAYKSTVGNFLYFSKTLINGCGTGAEKSRLTFNPVSDTIQNFIQTNALGLTKYNLTKFDPDNDDIIKIKYENLASGFTFFGIGDSSERFYIRLGTFLKFLQEYIVPKQYNKKNNVSSTLFFDTDENTNLMNVNLLQVGVDPTICCVNREIPFIKNSESKSYPFGKKNSNNPFINRELTNAINQGKRSKDKSYYGNIMNIYLDFTFILNKIDELKDDKGNLSLINFLKGLMSGINGGLGGINDFDVFLDETNNTIRIIDKNPLDNLEEVINYINNNYKDSFIWNNGKSLNQNKALLELGYSPQKPKSNSKPLAGFIKDFSLTTEMSSDFATIITVGAAARGSVVGENDTALSKLNLGFSDRYKETITNSIIVEDQLSLQKDVENKKKEFKKMYSDYCDYLIKLSEKTNLNGKDIDTFKFGLSSLLQKANDIDKIEEEISGVKIQPKYQGTGFLPFNLSLTMNGISGIKINQQFLLNTSLLPSNYPNVLLFIIKNLSHTIENNTWNTKIETYSVPKAVSIDTKDSSIINNTSTSPTSTTSPTPSQPAVLGAEADFWSLVAISVAENYSDNPQGMADVAQSIYNRLAAKTYGKSIKEIIVAQNQYEPTFKNKNDWRAIKDEATAIKAYQNSRGTSLQAATQAITTSKNALTSPSYKQAAKTFVGSRTEFYGGFENFVDPPNLEKGKQKYKELEKQGKAAGAVERNSLRDNLFFWRYSGKTLLYDKKVLTAQNPPSNIPKLA